MFYRDKILLSAKTFFEKKKSEINPVTMNKGTHFIGQPMCGQLLYLLDKGEILKFSRGKEGGTSQNRKELLPEFNTWRRRNPGKRLKRDGMKTPCRRTKMPSLSCNRGAITLTRQRGYTETTTPLH